MLYIHTLKDLSPRTADIESTAIIRQYKQLKAPINDHVRKTLSSFLISATDITNIKNAIEIISTTEQDIVNLSKSTGSFEPLNMKRACNALSEIEVPLKSNLEYAQEMWDIQQQLLDALSEAISVLPDLKTNEEKNIFNQNIGAVFEKILRSDRFSFRFDDIINEAHQSRVRFLEECATNLSFFHVKLDEYLKKDRELLRQKVDPVHLARMDQIELKIKMIKDGVDRAYRINMMMSELAVNIYAYIKWLGKE